MSAPTGRDLLAQLVEQRDHHEPDYLRGCCTCGDLKGKPIDDRAIRRHRLDVEQRDAGRWRTIHGRIERGEGTTWFRLEGFQQNGDHVERVGVSFVADSTVLDRLVDELDRVKVNPHGAILDRLVDELDRAGGLT